MVISIWFTAILYALLSHTVTWISVAEIITHITLKVWLLCFFHDLHNEGTPEKYEKFNENSTFEIIDSFYSSFKILIMSMMAIFYTFLITSGLLSFLTIFEEANIKICQAGYFNYLLGFRKTFTLMWHFVEIFTILWSLENLHDIPIITSFFPLMELSSRKLSGFFSRNNVVCVYWRVL